MSKIEILSPAGDYEALVCAIRGGADAVYFGTPSFNARIRARNFTLDTVREAVELCHAHGVRAYVTLNISIYNKELREALECVGELYAAGVDALIVADFGVAALIREHYPDFELHASTQCTAHSLDGVNLLNEALFMKRVVLARELDCESIEYISKNALAETEIFIHGAHCMSVSGQCLMSYAMGGRSGNRGECAQPCRLPYTVGNQGGYPLSLKDMSLCSHIDKILQSGASSLKIEGRMKGGEYVYGVTKTYRDLIDQKRNATKKEKEHLAALFSRQGFTDGYFLGRIDKSMLGIRTDKDKEAKIIQENATELGRVGISLYAELKQGEKSKLTLKLREKEITVFGDIAEEAINKKITEDEVKKNLVKLGNTPFTATDVTVKIEGDVMIKNSSINALRRQGIEKLLSVGREKREIGQISTKAPRVSKKMRTCVFSSVSQIPKSYGYFDIRFIYVDRYEKNEAVNGIYLPPVIFDTEWAEITKMMQRAYADGVRYCLVSNIGQVRRAKEMGFGLIADYRFNVFNAYSVRFLDSLGFENVILSPELSLPALRDFDGQGVIAYGKIPVMTCHKCPLKDSVGCEACRGYIKDRQGAQMYAEGVFGHRCVIHNSVPIYMADKLCDIKNLSHHFIFTDEKKEECESIINAYREGKEASFKLKRIK